MPKTKAVSPARSQGAITTPKRKSTRGSRSLCSPALSTASERLTSIIDQFKDKNMESFTLSPLNGRSVLNDNTEIEEPRRKSWWKKLNENSQDVMEVLEDNKLTINNAIDEFIDIEILSQEKKNVTLDIPDSSDNESINSIVLPQRRLFTQKENQPQKKFGQLIDNSSDNESINSIVLPQRRLFTQKENQPQKKFGQLIDNRESLAKVHKTNNTNIDKTVNVGTRELFRNAKRSKPIFPAALLNISPNKTAADKTKENVLADPKPQVRNIFGIRPGTKRKNMFADFIVSESEDEISDIQPRVFGFQNKIEQRQIRSVSRGRDPSPTSSITTEIEMDFRNMLPSSTMVENQLDEMMVSTPVKRTRLSKLSEAKESEAGANTLQTNSTGEKSKQSNKSVSSKNKCKASPEIQDKSLNSSRTTKSMLKNASKYVNMEEEGKRNESNENEDEANEIEKMEAEENDHQEIEQEANEIQEIEENADESEEVEAEENKSQQTKNESEEVNAEVNESQEVKGQDENNEEMLPSSTMVENQVEDMILSTPVKRSKLSKLSEAIESEAGSNTLKTNTTGDKTRQPNKYFSSKNKSKASPEIRDKSLNSSRTTRSMFKNTSKHEDVNASEQNKDVEMVEQDTNNSRDDNNVEKEYEPEDEINVSQENREEANKSEENDEEVNVSQKNDDEQNEVDNEDNESEEYQLRYHDSDDKNEEANESQHVEANINDSQDANESQEVVEDVDKSEEVEEKANESQEVETEANESQEVEEEANESQKVEDEVNESQEVEDEVNESQEVEAGPNESQEVEEEANESQEVEDEVNESQEVDAEANESQEDEEEANESQDIEDDQDENTEVMSENEEEAANESHVSEASANESQEVENDEEESQNEVASEAEDEDVEDDQQMDESDEADKAIASGPEISDDNLADEMEVDDDEEQESENEQNEHASHEEQNEIEASEEIEESPNVTHDTTGRRRKKRLSKSPEVMLNDKTKQMDSFTVKGRNTSIRKTVSLAPHRNSTGFSDGTKNSSAEGSGWDSHRTTRKTLRQTFGKDFTSRKSLRALVMEKSAKRQTEHMEMHSETVKFPLANSTEMPEDSAHIIEDIVESDHELSRRTRLSALEIALQKLKEQNTEKRLKLEAAVRNSLKNPPISSLGLYKVPNKPAPRRLNPAQTKPKKQLKSVIPLDELPAELIQDMKYKPPKRFRPSNASWITKRLYKFLEEKLEAQYDYKARVRAEKLAETLYNFTKDLRRHKVAPTDAVEVLKHEFARLHIVRTHFEFYEFFHEFMPREVRIKVVPDIVNKIPVPRHGVFSDILRE